VGSIERQAGLKNQKNPPLMKRAGDACGILIRSTSPGFAPGAKIHRVQAETEYVGGNKSELRSSETDETNDHAIDGRQKPTFPATLAYKNGRNDGKYAG
jgi:hypothetical protein